jgi:16S rRNA processing protein RimM
MDTPAEDFVALAVITSPHGVGGRVKLKCYTDQISHYVGSLTKPNGAPVGLRITISNGDMCIVEIDGLTDRNQAEIWRGTELGVPRSALPAIDEDGSFYIHDLIGLRAQTAGGEHIGDVTHVVNYGASDILIIQQPDGEELMLAFHDATIPNIDMDAGIIVCELPEMLEPAEKEPTPA